MLAAGIAVAAHIWTSVGASVDTPRLTDKNTDDPSQVELTQIDARLTS
jgi:hypothetical protein